MQRTPDHSATPSKAAIHKHPVHPMLIPFPIAFLCAAPLSDLIFIVAGESFWARASFWLVLAGLVSGAAAAAVGLIDFFGIRLVREHRAGWIHFIGNAVALGITAFNLGLRVRPGAAGVGEAIWPWGVTLSAAVMLILGVTGWYGGELSYRHRIGVFE